MLNDFLFKNTNTGYLKLNSGYANKCRLRGKKRLREQKLAATRMNRGPWPPPTPPPPPGSPPKPKPSRPGPGPGRYRGLGETWICSRLSNREQSTPEPTGANGQFNRQSNRQYNRQYNMQLHNKNAFSKR